MPEIRTNLLEQIHRLLKEEAARKGLHLKELIANILREHVEKEQETRR